MSVDRAGGWVIKTLIVVTGWLILEVAASYIHIAMIRRAKLCPMLEEYNKAKCD